MPSGLRRFQESGQSHFITFSCYRRQPKFVNAAVYDLFPPCLEDMRRRFDMRVYGYVVMPEHVHLLLSEPEHDTLAAAIHYLKLSFAKRVRSRSVTQVSVQKRDANLGHPHPRGAPRPRLYGGPGTKNGRRAHPIAVNGMVHQARGRVAGEKPQGASSGSQPDGIAADHSAEQAS